MPHQYVRRRVHTQCVLCTLIPGVHTHSMCSGSFARQEELCSATTRAQETLPRCQMLRYSPWVLRTRKLTSVCRHAPHTAVSSASVWLCRSTCGPGIINYCLCLIRAVGKTPAHTCTCAGGLVATAYVARQLEALVLHRLSCCMGQSLLHGRLQD